MRGKGPAEIPPPVNPIIFASTASSDDFAQVIPSVVFERTSIRKRNLAAYF